MECQEGSAGFEELEKHALQAGEPPLVSGKQVHISYVLCIMKISAYVLYDTTRDLHWYNLYQLLHARYVFSPLELPTGT